MNDITTIEKKKIGVRICWTDGFETIEIRNPSAASVNQMAEQIWETVRREILVDLEKIISSIRKMKPGTKRKFRIQPVWLTVEKDADEVTQTGGK